ncbi:hypothetical protein [Streptomyces sp. NBC_00091]|uniref:hypothetical protein n=1 Tax=Streptomyces sp. NBC_00091 TaxID=2975648 RepID=UPI002252AF60|nr:hypothetical protein [Streptomyces sp. NBC_00091]MCX5381189.1 hypothetical protein [Streptomyces sp. NBC_00091]
MTSPTPRGVLSLDTPDIPGIGIAAVTQPSDDLLARAQVGFERFTGGAEAQSDE